MKLTKYQDAVLATLLQEVAAFPETGDKEALAKAMDAVREAFSLTCPYCGE